MNTENEVYNAENNTQRVTCLECLRKARKDAKEYNFSLYDERIKEVEKMEKIL